MELKIQTDDKDRILFCTRSVCFPFVAVKGNKLLLIVVRLKPVLLPETFP